MLKLFPRLENFVDASYTKSIRLLENVGFKVEEPIEFGVKKALFRRYWIRTA